MKKFSFIVLLIFGIIAGIGLVQIGRSQTNGSVLSQSAPTLAPNIDTPTTSSQQVLPLPTKLTISKLNLKNIHIEYVGLDNEGKMDAPKDHNNVAWFELGYRPGKQGNSVLAGHYDKKDGGPAVFYDLNNLETGDEIILDTDDGKQKKFIVTDKKLYKLSEFPTENIFGKSDKKMLNLITCDGTWDPAKKSYSNRLVVFSELVE